MSLSAAEQAAKNAAMFPDDALCNAAGYTPSPDEALAFARYGLNVFARNIAMYSARRSANAAACYAAIARSL